MKSPDSDPSSKTPAEAELVGDIEAYQRRVERDWETARSVYQSRISEIMSEFLDKGTNEPAPSDHRTALPKKTAASAESVMARVTRELRSMKNRGDAPARPERPLLVGPVPRLSWGRIIAAAVGVTLLVVAFLSVTRIPEWTALPYQRTGAISVYGGKIYIADWFRKTLYVHALKRGIPIVSVENLQVGLVAGLQPDKEGLWTVDGLTAEILKHTATPDRQIVERFAAPDDKPSAITRDADDLWLAGLDSKILYRLRADDPTEVRDKYDLPLTHVTALNMQGKRLWALDGKAREVTLFRLQKPLKVLGTYDLDPFIRGATPTGLAIQGRNAWIVTENPSALVRLSLSKLKKSKG